MKSPRVRTVYPLLLPLLAFSASVTAEVGDGTKTKIDAFINNIMSCRNLVGLNLAVVRNGHVLWTDGYGARDVGKASPVTNSTYFGIASLSKAFAATLLGKVLSDRKIWYDEPVRRVLGDDFHFSDFYRSEHATFRDLLAHKTGVPSNNYARFQNGFDRQTLAKKMYLFNATLDFRTKFKYNNLIYGLISHITEEAGRSTWENLMTNQIFRPLGMKGTTFTHVVNLDDVTYATPHLVDYDTGDRRAVSMTLHKEWGKLGGSGSIFATADEMSKWLLFQLNDGKNQQGQQILEKRYFEETHKASFWAGKPSSSILYTRPHVPVTYAWYNYALGWRTGYYKGYEMVLHTGSSWGYGALLTLIPSLNIGIYTGINSGDPGYTSRRLIHMYILDLLMGDEPWLNLTTSCTFPKPWIPVDISTNQKGSPNNNTKAQRPLTEYVGTYGNFAFGNISIVIEDNILKMRYGKIGRWTLQASNVHDEFFGKGSEVIWPVSLRQIKFSENSGSGRIDRVTIPRFETSSPPVFIRDLKMSDAPAPPKECPHVHIDYKSGVDSRACQFSVTLIISVFSSLIITLSNLNI